MVVGKGKPPHSLKLYIEGGMVSYPLKAGNVDSPLPTTISRFGMPIDFKRAWFFGAKGISLISLGFG
jgi:hypothetical protein